jgi:hypothetical protein
MGRTAEMRKEVAAGARFPPLPIKTNTNQMNRNSFRKKSFFCHCDYTGYERNKGE